MKPIHSQRSHLEEAAKIWQAWSRRKYPTYLFLVLCFNLIVAPMVWAATGETFSRPQAYALGMLAITSILYSIYLFVVMFQPERF